MSERPPCLLCGSLLGVHRDSCPITTVKPWSEREPGMQTIKVMKRQVNRRAAHPAKVQALWLAGATLAQVAEVMGIAPQECEDIMRKRTARLVRERGRR